MSVKPLVSIVLGTRPEAIKLAPVIEVFKASQNLNTRIIFTGHIQACISQSII